MCVLCACACVLCVCVPCACFPVRKERKGFLGLPRDELLLWHVIMYSSFTSLSLAPSQISPLFFFFSALILQELPAEPQVVAISVCPTALSAYTHTRCPEGSCPITVASPLTEHSHVHLQEHTHTHTHAH